MRDKAFDESVVKNISLDQGIFMLDLEEATTNSDKLINGTMQFFSVHNLQLDPEVSFDNHKLYDEGELIYLERNANKASILIEWISYEKKTSIQIEYSFNYKCMKWTQIGEAIDRPE